MITYLTTDGGRSGMDNFLFGRGKRFASRIRILTYSELARRPPMPSGTYIFADQESLTPRQKAGAGLLWDRLAERGPEVRLLNNPHRVLLRYDLLRTLFDLGHNRFNAIRATDSWAPLRYPVFIREASKHTGDLSGLLHSEAELRRALLTVLFLGFPCDDLLIVEFCDTSLPDGMFRKFSAFIVGETVIPRYADFGLHWVVRHARKGPQRAEEIRRFFTNFPHDSWVREMARISGTGYGRIDYGLIGDNPQLWEINLNPNFGKGNIDYLDHRPPNESDSPTVFAKKHFFGRFAEALDRLDFGSGKDMKIWSAFPPDRLHDFVTKRRGRLSNLYFRFLLTRKEPYRHLNRLWRSLGRGCASLSLNYFPLWAERRIRRR